MSNPAFFVKFLASYVMEWSSNYNNQRHDNQGINYFNGCFDGFNQGLNGPNHAFNGMNQGYNNYNRYNQDYNKRSQFFNGNNQDYNNCNQNFNRYNQGYNNCNQNYNRNNQGCNNFNRNFNGNNCNQAIDYNRNCNNFDSCNDWNMRYSHCRNQGWNMPNNNYKDRCYGPALPQIDSKQQNERKRTRSRRKQTQQLTKVAKKSLQNTVKERKEALKQALSKKIESTNKGYELLQKMGYTEGQGLGKEMNGLIEPIKIELKTDRKGLGLMEDVKPLTKKQRKRLAKAQRNEKAGTEAKNMKSWRAKSTAIPMPLKLELSVKEKHIMLKRMMQTEAEDQETAIVMAATPQKRAHSPIRAPSPSSSPLFSFHVNKNAASTPLKNTSNTLPQAKALNKSTAKAFIKQTMESIEATVNNTINKRLIFSLNERSSAHQLALIAEEFRDEIEILQSQLDAKFTRPNEDADPILLVVAEITIFDCKIIENPTFEYIRTELVGWIGKYQVEQLNTPIFHSMLNNDTHITIVCEDSYAFGCVEQCIAEIAQTSVLPVQVARMPSISNTLYCFGAIYAGVIREPELFLAQIKLHKFNLASDHWIIVSHKVCEQPQQRETHFMFLLDEQSALALTYHYHNKLFVCLQLVEFFNRGRLVANF